MMRKSAGTMAPSDSCTMSPGTSSAASAVAPRPVAPDPHLQRQPLLEKRQRRVGAALLKHAERHVDDQQRRDHRRLDAFADRELEHNRRFEHPRHRRPEMAQHLDDGMRPFLRHRVRAVLREAARGLPGGQPGADRSSGRVCGQAGAVSVTTSEGRRSVRLTGHRSAISISRRRCSSSRSPVNTMRRTNRSTAPPSGARPTS